MKHEDKKDEKLNELFGGYVESERMPSENVTAAAKEELARRSKQRVPAEEPVVISAGGASHTHGVKRVSVAVLCAAAFLIVVAVALLLIFNGGKARMDLMNAGDAASTVSCSQLVQINSGGEHGGELVELIGGGSVIEYSEYALSESVGAYSGGDVVLRRMECTVPPGLNAVLYVESGGIECAELEQYKSLPQSREVDGDTFMVGENSGHSLIYFTDGGCGFNLQINSVNEAEVFNVLKNISKNIG